MFHKRITIVKVDELPVPESRARTRSLISVVRAKIQHKRSKSNNIDFPLEESTTIDANTTLDAVLKNTNMTNELIDFSSREFSQENIILYQKIQAWKLRKDIETAKKLYDVYIRVGAKEEVNLDAYIVSEVQTCIKENPEGIGAAFELVENLLLRNIQDTFGRMLNSQTRS
jgi:hypothetical protein